MHTLDPHRLPTHVGIIMDGNGRWAVHNGKPRREGHQEGLQAAKRVVKSASAIGLSYLTLYTFSTENWKRIREEVRFLMFLLKTNLKREYDFYRENRIRIVHSGNVTGLPQDVADEIRKITSDTAHHDGLTVNLAINYGGRDEIVRAVQRIVDGSSNGAGNIAGITVTEKDIQANLDQPTLPDPDLIIRTAGELRLSNFLIWQCAYAEFYFSPKYWPDWDEHDLTDALLAYQNRARRYGGNL